MSESDACREALAEARRSLWDYIKGTGSKRAARRAIVRAERLSAWDTAYEANDEAKALARLFDSWARP